MKEFCMVSRVPAAIRAILSVLSLLAAAHGVAAPSTPTRTITVPGLKQNASILVDRWGVPHIYANDEADLFFAQGFNAARDR